MDPQEFDPTPGSVTQLDPGIRRILAPNPSPMTFRGTNTYLLGDGDVAVIDPGPDSARHHQAILEALRPAERITHILVTHSHIDHSPLAARLSQSTGAQIYAYGDSFAGRSCVMEQLANDGLTGGGEGVDADFAPDILLKDGDNVEIGALSIKALWTPGHFGNHLSFLCGDAVFTGDTVMGWASTMVSPPDGDLTAFLASAAKLSALNARVFHPGHGAPITNATERANWLIAHRNGRETEILSQLSASPQTIPQITKAIYTDVPQGLLAAAERNVFAHLIDLHQRNRVQATPELSIAASFHKS